MAPPFTPLSGFFDDKHWRLIRVVIANTNDAQCPPPQRDLIARAPSMDR
jgi:hypothetical protein